MDEITYRPIGVIHSPFKQPRGTPIQPAAGRDVEGTVEVFPEYVEGLKDVDGFSHVILIYGFHLCKGFSLKVKPYLDDRLRGVFATRAPARPNPIGMSIVRLVRAEGGTLHIRDLDIVDGTPLLDIKPYVPEFDAPDVQSVGWLQKNVDGLPKARDDGRFVDRRRG
ncbi:S-adenosyl-L-methionine-binding protein [candidate division KD3-62 bacterium DG_56]|uniref:S-adenosyl-L-methionine-binding protein n=1 Tax=candidate division KD3-62 bacterium DG_56 TaxID=1704032 RepID=A0A0S7XMH3_9BACT|nr:MAG: S-adenosyl-L-methionine-binding protein [candidate division KD3-62 bacterium DG_56]